MCWEAEPLDIVMFILKLCTKCGPDWVRKTAYVSKMFISVALDCMFSIAIYILLIRTHFSEEVQEMPWPYLGYSILICIVLSILPIMYAQVAQDKMEWRTFFLTYKGIDFCLGVLNAVGLVYGRDDIDFEDWRQVIIVILTGFDVIVNPIQMVIACRSSSS